MEDEDIDIETLQSQIDLSNSFAEELVSSWIKPSRLNSEKSSGNITQKELEEYARRPPRLGVGAPIPESTGVSGREGMRLKSQLLSNGIKGKKREREDVDKKEEVPSDDDEESRTGAIRKKTKVDVFGGPTGGKKSKQKGKEKIPSNSRSTLLSERTQEIEEPAPEVDGKSDSPDELSPVLNSNVQQDQASLPATPDQHRKKKKKKRMKAGVQVKQNGSPVASTASPSVPPTASPDHIPMKKHTTSTMRGADEIPIAKETTKLESHTEPRAVLFSGFDGPPEHPLTGTHNTVVEAVANVQDHATSSIPKNGTSASLLNLDGPPFATEHGDGSASPKKKRKRRKKKKSMVPDGAHAGFGNA